MPFGYCYFRLELPAALQKEAFLGLAFFNLNLITTSSILLGALVCGKLSVLEEMNKIAKKLSNSSCLCWVNRQKNLLDITGGVEMSYDLIGLLTLLQDKSLK